MLLHTITGLHPMEMNERGMPLSFEFARFVKFIVTEFFRADGCPRFPWCKSAPPPTAST